jgi:uncharacterized protein
VEFEFDDTKNTANRAKHGVDFAEAYRFNWAGSVTVEDTRRPYGEPRFVTYGEIDGRVHVLVFTVRAEIIRVISLRKANDREIASYERQKR